ncbi:MAG: hypothetical protein AAGC53_12585 [Actinomycetota bacterium]
MSDVLAVDLNGANDLLRAYRRAESIVGNDAERIRTTLASARPYLDAETALSATRVPHLLRVLAELLASGAEDLSWRLAYLEARGDAGFPLALPPRDPALQALRVADLLVLLDRRVGSSSETRPASEVLIELARRATADPSVAAAIAERLDEGQLGELGELVAASMLEVTQRGENLMVLSDEERSTLERDIVEVHWLIDAYGIVLAGFSHDETGRRTVTEALGLNDLDDRIAHLPLALSAGNWDGSFLIDVASRMFSDAGAPMYTQPYVSALWYPGGRETFRAVADPGAVMLDALRRTPSAAHEFIFDHDGFWQMLGEGDGYFGRLVHDPGGMFDSPERERARAELVRMTLGDPSRVEATYELLFGDFIGGERGRDGIFATMIDHGRLDRPLTVALAEVWAMQWGNLTDTTTPRDNMAQADQALALLFEVPEAREIILSGFAPYIEATFADAFREAQVDRSSSARAGSHEWSDLPSAAAVNHARDRVSIGFQMLDYAIDEAELDVDDNGRARGAFRAGVGYAGRQVSGWLSLASFPAAIASFALSEVAGDVASSIFPDERYDGPTSQGLLEQLFVGRPSHPDARYGQPPSGQIALANAALAADPSVGDGLATTTWFDGEVITPPPADSSVRELDAFADWFGALVQQPGAPLESLVDLNQDLAQDAAVVG